MNNDQPQKTSSSQYPGTLESRYFFLIFCISTIFLGRILWPFWSILILSFLLASLFRPIYSFLGTRRLSASFASILTCTLIIFLVFIPLLLFIGALSSEALSLYQWGRDAGVGLQIHSFLQKSPLVTQVQTYLHGLGLNFEPAQLTDALSSFIKAGGLFLYNQASSWAANILKFLALFCMMILIIFFLLIDQENLVAFFIRLSPLPDHEDRLLLAKFEETANAILKGTIVCGLIQGIIIGAVFAIFGLNAPILWGCIMAVVACLPIPGIGLVIIIPTAMILAINGQIETGIVLSLFYMVLSFSIEYVIKPKMVGGQVKMHTLLVFLSLMGGITVYGVLGIIYGPLIVTAFLTLSDIYLTRYDFSLQKNIKKTKMT
ncbi:MAG: AI-2E family transporter [Deltaproteobacteria bacterium]|nr:AI-2E family transporter [Deltaproteobacteria bacterium]